MSIVVSAERGRTLSGLEMRVLCLTHAEKCADVQGAQTALTSVRSCVILDDVHPALLRWLQDVPAAEKSADRGVEKPCNVKPSVVESWSVVVTSVPHLVTLGRALPAKRSWIRSATVRPRPEPSLVIQKRMKIGPAVAPAQDEKTADDTTAMNSVILDPVLRVVRPLNKLNSVLVVRLHCLLCTMEGRSNDRPVRTLFPLVTRSVASP